MSASTSIEWTDKTWNPVRGCARVSPGCENCYAERMAHRFSGKGQPYEGLTVLGKHGPRWAGAARFVPDMLGEPLRWRKPQRVFVNSMSDLFHEDVTNEQIADIFQVMAKCRQHTFQILTKRPKRMVEWFGWMGKEATEEWPLPNVWLGVSCESQKYADERIPLLLQTPATVRFISAEPLLGPVRLDGFLRGKESHSPFLDWVIVGGESGNGARICDIEWIRAIARQCSAAGVACFVKQLGSAAGIAALGAYVRRPMNDRKGGDINEFPADMRVREFPA